MSEVLAPASPAAGANLSYVFEDDFVIENFTMQLVTSATVANRRFKWMLTDASDNVLARGVAAADQAASLTWQHFSTPGCPSMAAVQNLWLGTTIPAGGIDVTAGMKLKTSIDNLQAGDQISGVKLVASRSGRLY